MREEDNIASTERVGGEILEESHLFVEDSCSGMLYSGLENRTEQWKTEQHCSLNDSESEEVLNAINPNEVYTSSPVHESTSISPSEDLCSDEKISAQQVYQVVYDISGLGAVIADPGPAHTDVISIELDEWSSQMLLSDSCVVNELMSSVKTENDTQQTHCFDSSMVFPDLQLTEEEQMLLNQEGISLPNNLPLTKAEERILKKVRRKIRNKLSAQDSRRRRKEYIDGLESRVAACSAQNTELQRTVEQLEKHNISLITQLNKLQALIKQTATKAAQTGTCIMIIIFSLGLIIFPSYSPFRWRSSEDSYAPSAVMSRNILNDVASLSDDVVSDEPMISEPTSFDRDPKQSDILISKTLQMTEDGTVQQASASENDTAVSEEKKETIPVVSLVAPVNEGKTGSDANKSPHADEM